MELNSDTMQFDCGAEVKPQVVAMPRAGDTCDWHILSCPWWLNVKEDDEQLTFWPRNCGRHQGQMRLEIDGVESRIEVRSCVRPTWVLAIWTAFKVLLVGVATIVLAVILGFVCGIVIPLFGGPPGVAIAGAVFCFAWGAMIGGGQFATRCRIVGLFSLLFAAGLVIGTLFLATQILGEANAFALAMSIGGAVVGAALGKVAGGRRMVFVSAVVGLLAWLVASLPTVSEGAGLKGVGTLFGLMFTPGTGLTIWGVVMGALLAPCPVMTAAKDATPTAAEIPELLPQSDEVI
jgi:hypothetical protein